MRLQHVPELDLSQFIPADTRRSGIQSNGQTAEVFASEQREVEEGAPSIVWRRPSDHDDDRLGITQGCPP